MQFDRLNNDCLREILPLLPTRQLIVARSLSTRWEAIAEDVLRNKNSLKLFADYNSMVEYFGDLVGYNLQDEPYYQLQKDDPDEVVGRSAYAGTSSAFLPKLMPKLTKLIIYSGFANNIDVGFLLTKWPDLFSLSVFNLPPKPTWCMSISRMTKLTRLELFNIDLSTLLGHISVEDLTPVLSGLEQFALGYCTQDEDDETDHITPLLMALNPDRLLHLTLNQVPFTYDQLERLIRNKPELPEKLTHLTVNLYDRLFREWGISEGTLRLIADNFTVLTFFSFSPLPGTSVSSILLGLFNLTTLAELRIFYRGINRQPGYSGFYSRLVMPMESVRRLHLNGCTHMSGFDLCRMFSVAFPHLEEITVAGNYILKQQLAGVFGQLRKFTNLQKSNVYSIDELERFVGKR